MQLVAYPLAVPRSPARQRTRLDPLRTDFTLRTCSPAPFRGDWAPLGDFHALFEVRVDAVRFLFLLVLSRRRCS